ncbi:hypothetical protein HNV12_16075 [Methanococcoides sp. SA1]|nr:hypothetical protein [Methanococcoides sp. SA1]
MDLSALISQFTLPYIIGTSIGIIGIAIAIRSKKEKKPCYSTRSFNLVNNLISKVESLKIIYSDKEIKNVTISKLIFWNKGRETIEGSEITTIEPLFIKPKGSIQILDAKIIYSKESANGFSLKKIEGKQGFQLIFDYVDKGEGIIVQIIHTGTSGKDIEIVGKIKGAGKPKYALISTSPFKYPYLSFRQTQFLVGTLMGLAPLVLFYIFINMSYVSSFFWIVFAVLGVGMLATMVFIYKATVPHGFEAYYDDF